MDFSIQYLDVRWLKLVAINVSSNDRERVLRHAVKNAPRNSRLIHIRRGKDLAYSCTLIHGAWQIRTHAIG